VKAKLCKHKLISYKKIRMWWKN